MHVCMYIDVCVYMYVYVYACVCMCVHSFIVKTVFSFMWAFLTPHLFGVCLDDIYFMVILLDNKSRVIL